MNYAVIEYTPGYLPEDDDPPQFDQWAEAVNYVLAERERLFDEEWAYDYPPVDPDSKEVPEFMLDVGDFNENGFVYYDKRKIHDLGRIVEIVALNYKAAKRMPNA